MKMNKLELEFPKSYFINYTTVRKNGISCEVNEHETLHFEK